MACREALEEERAVRRKEAFSHSEFIVVLSRCSAPVLESLQQKSRLTCGLRSSMCCSAWIAPGSDMSLSQAALFPRAQSVT
eukprot:2194427-Rhodomonas_salina.1